MNFLDKEISLHTRQGWDIIFWTGIMVSIPLHMIAWILAPYLLWGPTILLMVSFLCMYKNNKIALIEIRRKKEEEKNEKSNS